MNATTPTAKTTKTAKPSGFRPCRCSEYFVADEVETDGQPDFANVVTTGCTKNVAGRTDFAPGHDAKLKSLLINAKRSGRGAGVKRNDGGVLVHFSSAESAAGEYGFYAMVANCAVPQDRRPRARKVAKAEQPSTVWAKVGRWAYEGVEDTKTGRFIYRDKSGREHATSNYRISDVLDTPGIQTVSQAQAGADGPAPF